jgi:hypothetical protein
MTECWWVYERKEKDQKGSSCSPSHLPHDGFPVPPGNSANHEAINRCGSLNLWDCELTAPLFFIKPFRFRYFIPVMKNGNIGV